MSLQLSPRGDLSAFRSGSPVRALTGRLLLAALLSGLAQATVHAFEREIILEEHLGHSWEEALVHRRVQVARQGDLFAGQAALFRDGEPVPMQLDNLEVWPNGSLREVDVVFRSDLPANGSRQFVLRSVKKPPKKASKSDLDLILSGNTLELSNGHTAVRLPGGSWQPPDGMSKRSEIAAALAGYLSVTEPSRDLPGPLLGVKLNSGRWTASSCLKEKESFEFEIQVIQPIREVAAGQFLGYETRVLAQGPLFHRVRVTYRFAEGGEYAVDVTLRAQEPFVRLDERYQKAGALVLDLGENLTPSSAAYLSYRVKPGHGAYPIDYDNPGLVSLFLGWDGYYRRAEPALAFMGDPAGDCLGLVSTDTDWLPHPYNQAFHVATAPGKRLLAKASLTSGQRHWALHVGKTADFPKPDIDFYRMWWQQVAFPLDKVANWELVWPGMLDLEFPHTFLSRSELPEVRKRLQGDPVIAKFMKGVRPTQQRSLTDAAIVALYSGEAQDQEVLKELFLKDNYLDQLPAAFLDEPGFFANNRFNYMQITDELLKRYVGTELMLGSDLLTPQQRRHTLTRIAFAVYVMDDLMYWPPNYPFNPHKDEFYPVYVQGTPNQKTCYITGRGISACMIRNHPRFQRWMGRVLAEFDRVVSDSVAPSGAHLESPFYSCRDTMRFGPFWTAVIRSGVGGAEVEKWTPRLKRCFQYLSDMLTVREPRMGGRRVNHPVGRSSPGVIDPTMMIAAEPFGQGDLDFKRRMRWCWEEQGRPSPSIMGTTGGRDMSLTLLAFARLSGVEPCESPPLKSVRYEGMGAIFRSQVGTDHESNVLFRHDPFAWNLYEGNNGAVYLYGKGAPLLPRFGGYWMGQQGQPNLMSIPFGNRIVFGKGESVEWTDALGNMTDYASLGNLADCASGTTRDKHWRRDVLFAKDLDREDPLYLLVRDEVNRPGSASALHWWVMSRQVQPDGLEKPGVVPVKGSDKAWLANLGKNWMEAPKLTGQSHHFEGHCGVDLDLFIAAPAKPKIITDAVGVGPGLSYCVNRKLYEYQQLIRIEQPEGQGYLTLLTPRWPGSDAPEYRTLGNGDGVAITSNGREDRLFVGGKATSFKDEAVTFSGRAGFARIGGAASLRLMVRDGSISAKGVTLAASHHAALLHDGTGVTVFCSGDTEDVKVTLPPELKGLTVSFRREQP